MDARDQQIVRETVMCLLDHLGIEPADIKEVKKDMQHLRRLRVGSEMVKGVALKTCVGTMVAGLIYLLVEGVLAWLSTRQ